MDIMKEDILELINNARYRTLGRDELAKRLNLTHALEYAEFDRLLDEMEQDAELIRDRANKYMTREQAGIIIGVVHVNRRGIGYVDRENQPSIMIQPYKLQGAMEGDTVAVMEEHGPTRNESVPGRVVKILKRGKSFAIGTYISTPNGPRFWPDDERFRGVSVSMKEPADFTPLPGMKVAAVIDSYGNPMEMTYVRTIGFKDDPGVDLLSVLLDHGFSPDFPEEVMAQAEAIPQEVPAEELTGREDLTGDITITIDGDDSKDFDDAVAVVKTEEGWTLKVSIADVSHYVTEGSPLDQEAALRGTSCYVIDKVVPMLPQLLSNGICSLNPHVIRLTNTCEMKISESGMVTDYKVYPSFIRSTERMTYKNVNKILDNDPEVCEKYAHLTEMLSTLRDCADAIRARRISQGAIDFASDESEIRVDETGKPIYVGPAERGHGERIIEDCMIVANVSVARLMNRNDFPCVYRIHSEPNMKKLTSYGQMAYMMGHPFKAGKAVTQKQIQSYLESIQDTDVYDVLSGQMLRCMAKAVYDASCLGHYGLAEREYLHFTSPIRRYPDLIVHRMLRRYYYEKEYSRRKRDEELTRQYAESSSVREREADAAEYECDDMKKAEYMESHIGMTAEGIITSVHNFGFYVMLPDTIEGVVHVDSLFDGYYRYDSERMALVNDKTHSCYRIGDHVKVVVTAASKQAKTVEFGVVRSSGGKLKEKTEPKQKKHNTRSRSARKSEQYGYELNTKKRGSKSPRGRNQNGRSKKRKG